MKKRLPPRPEKDFTVCSIAWDLDIVHRRTPENVERLLRVLRDIQATARSDPRHLKPDETHLIGPGHVLLETRFGDFDCLGAIDGGRAFEDLLASSVVLDFEGRPIRVLALREILAVKRRAARPKDLAAIPRISDLNGAGQVWNAALPNLPGLSSLNRVG